MNDPWVKISVLLPSHPKIVGLSSDAKWAYVASICYSGQYLTDGHLTFGAARSLATQKVHKELIDASLWELNGDGGLIVHDYTVHNRPRDEVVKAKKAQSEGGKKGNEKRWGDGESHA